MNINCNINFQSFENDPTSILLSFIIKAFLLTVAVEVTFFSEVALKRKKKLSLNSYFGRILCCINLTVVR